MKSQISALALARFGFLQTISFVAAGVGVCCVAVVLRSFTTGIAATVGTSFMALAGVSLFVVAAFPTDVIGRPGKIILHSNDDLVHVVATLTGLVAGMVCAVMFTAIFRRARRWECLMLWSAGSAACALVGLIARSLGLGDGLVERLTITALGGWVAAVGIRAWRLLAAR